MHWSLTAGGPSSSGSMSSQEQPLLKLDSVLSAEQMHALLQEATTPQNDKLDFDVLGNVGGSEDGNHALAAIDDNFHDLENLTDFTFDGLHNPNASKSNEFQVHAESTSTPTPRPPATPTSFSASDKAMEIDHKTLVSSTPKDTLSLEHAKQDKDKVPVTTIIEKEERVVASRQRLREEEEVMPQVLRMFEPAREKKRPARTTESVDVHARAGISALHGKSNAARFPTSGDPDFERQRAPTRPFVNAPSVTDNSASSAPFNSADHGHHT
ncbi:hypothetical protein HPB51_020420 [Rhipicephalus microplus]|uniref:Uncharacterized protein n=1 Tax=Rhipicephalus microplus TaxID=6941 RepID=A0A9J6DWI0_RHIMP|nr:hypothetical protein HPB51_020420 [Rhipicephalus microplus]